MKLFKKISIVILSIIAMFSFSMFFACDCGGSNSPTPSGPVEPPKLEVLTFEKSSVDLVVGDEEYLVLKVNNVSSNINIKYASSDEGVVTVSNTGKVTATGKGQAEVTASFGDFSAKCNVNVTHGNYLPSLVINNLSNDRVIVPQGVDYQIDNYILFNSKKFTNASYNYQTSNGNIRVDENGVIRGLSLGETKVTVTASWDGFSGIASLTKTFTVKVTPFVQLLINGGATSKVTLFNKPLETLNGTTPIESDFVVTALDEKGQELEYSVELVNSDDAKYVVYDETEQKLVAQGLLTPAPVTVKVSVPVSETENYELFVEVECVRALGDYMNAEKTAYEVVDFNTLTGIIDLEAIFGFETELDLAKLGREELIIDGNKIVGGIEGDAFSEEPEHVVITVYDEQQGYNVEIIPYVYKDAVELDDSFNFSAHDGEFFNSDYAHQSPEDLLGSGAKIEKAYLKTVDGQKELLVSEDGSHIVGFDKVKTPEAKYMAIGSDQKMVYLSVTAYSLIIDQMSDFEYFYVPDGTWSYKPNKFNIVAGLEWDGYYVLANDIDATMGGTYEFKGLQNGFRYLAWGTKDTYYNASFATLGANYWENNGPEKVGLKGKGFQGVFDGMGHTISNYKPLSGGLFQFLNGGVVKNLGFENASVGSSEGVICAIAFNYAYVENVFVQINPEKSYGGKWAGASLIGSLGTTVKMNKVVVVNEGTSIPVGSSGGALASFGQSATTYGSDYSNVYVVSPQYLQFSKSSVSGLVIDYEASFVDGVEVDSTTIKTVPNVRRYSNFANFYKDSANVDSSAFDTSMWKLLGGSVPVMASAIKDDSLEIYVGETKANETGCPVSINANTPITLRYGGLVYDYVDSLTIKTGADKVSVNGDYNVYGTNIGDATLVATFNRDGRVITREFKVIAVPEAQELDTEYYFSAKSSEFFSIDDATGQLTLVNDPLSVLFGKNISGSDLYAAFDSVGNPLDIVSEPGKLLGLNTISDGYLDTFFRIYSKDAGVKVSVKAADLIIDEAEDLRFFTLKDRATYNMELGFGYYFTNGDYEWNGYYVLANDIDASEYGIHDLENGKLVTKNSNGNEVESNLRAFVATRFDYLAGDGIQEKGKGFTGTFDGQGYTISNLTTTQSGLLGIINDSALIKNLGLINCKVSNNAGAPLAWAISNTATLRDIYVLTDESKVSNYYSPLVATWGENVNASNVIIEDRVVADPVTKAAPYAFGSLSYHSIDHAGTQTPIAFKNGAFNNVFVVSQRALSVNVPASVSGTDVSQHTISLDAEIVDTQPSAASNLVKGIKRYSSSTLMRLDETNDYSSFSSDVWTMVNGVPKFTSALANTVSVYLGEGEVNAGAIELVKGASYEVTLRIDGQPIDLADFGGAIEVTVVSGSSVSVSGTTISANQATEDLAQIKVSNSKYEFNFTIDVIFAAQSYEHELYLSSVEGKFYDANYNPVSVDTIFNVTDVDVIKAYNELGEFLTVGDNNEIFGVKVSPKEIVDTQITLYSEEKALIVNVKSLSLLIDELEDLEYFVINENYTFKNNQYLFVESDYCWNGYYLLTKDIDATGYTHDIKNGKGGELTEYTGARLDYLAGSGFNYGAFIHGFLGTFDGQGHVISNLTTTESGLFGVIAGGAVIKDVAFINNGVDTNDGGFLAWAICDNAKVENVYVETNYDVVAGRYAPFIATWGPKAKAENVIVVDNSYRRDYAVSSEYKIGSLTADARHQGNYKDKLIPFPETAFSNYYIISNKALSEIIEEDVYGYEGTIKMDAQYVDGVENTADGMITGINRYTSMAKFTEAITANPDLLANFASSNVWEIASGSISFKGASDVVISNVVLGDKVVTNRADVYVGDVFNVGLMVNGEITNVDSVAVQEDDITSTTVEGTTLKIGSISGSVEITVTVGEDEYVVILNVLSLKVKFNDTIVNDGDVFEIMLGSTNKVDVLRSLSSIEGWTIDTPETTDVISIENGVITASNSVYGQTEVRIQYNSWTLVFTVVVERPDVYINNTINERYSTAVKVDNQIEVTLKYNNVALDGELTLTADNSNVTIEGNVIKGAVVGSSVVTVVLNDVTFNINVLVPFEVEELDIEPYFSAGDGVFFNETLTGVLSAEELFGSADVEIVAAEDEDGNSLAISKDGAILGLKTGNQLESKTITIYTTSKSIKVTVKAYSLIIDEVSDLAFFGLKSAVTNDVVPASGEGVFDGYYVLMKNIDASEYTHQFAGTSEVSFTPAHFAKAKTLIGEDGALYGKYFTGTFDGQGYTISNLGFNATIENGGGLLGYINGGTVKNLGIIAKGTASNGTTASAYSGVLAGGIMGDAVLSDLYIQVDGSRNNSDSTGIITGGIASSVTLTRLMVVWNGTKNMPIGAGILVDDSSTTELLNANMTDCYLIADVPAALGATADANTTITSLSDETVTTGQRYHIVTADAKYVDDVENTTSTAKTFHKAWNLNTTVSTDTHKINLNGEVLYEAPYSIGLLTGLKRYTKISNMSSATALANNDFSNWSGDVWEIINGVPKLANALAGEYRVEFAGNVLSSDISCNVLPGSSFEVKAYYKENALEQQSHDIPSLKLVSGEGVVSVNGNTITAIAGGNATVEISFKGKTYTVNFSVQKPAQELDTHYQFSAADGLFFDGANVVPVSDVLGGSDPVVNAYDADGNILTITEDGAILGYETSAKDWLSTCIYLYTENAGYKVYLDIAELIIDDKSDLAYFGVDGTVTNGVLPEAGKGIFDGFYVLVKDIDATGYVHAFADESLEANYFNASTRGFTNVKADVEEGGALYGKYMTGVFDGQGYTISNYMMLAGAKGNGGLFGIINGGTVKNVAFDNINKTSANAYSNSSGILATYIVNGATVSDVYIHYAGNMNDGSPNGLISSAVEADCIVKNVLINWTGNKSVGGESGLVGTAIDEANQALQNVYLISNVSTQYVSHYHSSTWDKTTGEFIASTGWLHRVAAEAKYVDGVEQTAKSKLFHKAWGLTTTYSTDDYDVMVGGWSAHTAATVPNSGIIKYTEGYDIKLLNGVKRYTSIDKLKADAKNNDFSSWNSDVWEVIDGVPSMLRKATGEYTAFFAGSAVSDSVVMVQENSSYEAIIKLGDSVIGFDPVVEITSGNEYVSVDGNVVTPIKVSDDETVTIKITYRNNVWTQNLRVTVPATDYETELQFSAADGVFFNGENVVAVSDIVTDNSYTKITDKDGNVLTLSEGKILGMTTSTKDWEENQILFNYADHALRVNVKVAELIIDDKSDFAYFKASGTSASYGKACFGVGGSAENDLCEAIYAGSTCPVCGHSGAANEAWAYYWATQFDREDDMNWKGYYVLAKDINAEGYTHDLRNGYSVATTAYVSSRYDYLGNTGWFDGEKAAHGFAGVFDGQGHTISNLTTIAYYGLFGIINTGTIQNVGFVNCNTTTNAGGFLAYAAIRGASFKDVYVSTPAITPGAEYTPLVNGIGHAGNNWERVVIIDNTTDEYVNTRYYGSITADAARHANYLPATFNGPFKGVYVVSNKPMQARGNGTEYVAGLDARYVDGVQITLTASASTTNAQIAKNISDNIYKEGTDLTVDGIYRYTTYEKFKADASNRDFSGFSSSMWNIVDGVPVWAKA